nr:hypothetical protein PHYPA_011611 [Physcomitrium patens]
MADQQTAELRNDLPRVVDGPSPIALFLLQGLCGAAVVVGMKALPDYYGMNLVAHPVATIQLSLAVTLPTVIVAHSLMMVFSSSPRPAWRCIGGGLISLPVGALLAALLALAFGAPASLQYASGTFHWACLMSVLVALPAAIVLGSFWPDWQRIFAFTRPRGGMERAICIPAHGAVIGAWIGAFPMPLDWERPWQEWPISCTYGAVGGYLIGLTVSMLLLFIHPRDVRSKVD